ncbi:excinuclease ABC subunit B [Candidatus Roizmanbacteria bacterium RIFCSPHIGHO2_02_FULL_37_13b]|uniref:UvrABC system protein B n=1 Tax=Candidatus Roizmanbacteria bacterium RIFCSPLOWO2_02_FULL_36_11 TaxID=1802071 RepID=A0A1F7JHX5_9BACT|nr:MAG: excinuclease ABC subunit B [Candidatus Roizmanbacteria bacterium RIFCSPHIGHO2_02_FULL_37_13b]OGK55214.1 MAG: excinuclease ABC subunit B [Candidatus Roizmanbacteria bacterium RIFCSPLOWO2_02_FULL_36_11]
MNIFNLESNFSATDDQTQAIAKLVDGIKSNIKNQVLLGVTGSGKTFTMANIIKQSNLPTLIISHNKTLAGQLFQEMRDFFPKNSISYFVSYYDFYQPEAYLPATDIYIQKEAMINDLIDKMRLKATSNIMTRDDVVVVASVSCIYNIGSPREYGQNVLTIDKFQPLSNKNLAKRLIELQYERSEFDFSRGTFRIRGNNIDIYPAYEDTAIHLEILGDKLRNGYFINPISGEKIAAISFNDPLVIYPAKHYLADQTEYLNVESKIRHDLKLECDQLLHSGKLIEAQRLLRKVNYDLEMIKEVGYVNGIENYSRYFDGRAIGDPPFTLIDYFSHRYKDKWLAIIDESHMTIPQIRGMYHGDNSRKKTLIDYGFRMQAALDNRPFKFDEFYVKVPKFIYASATPDEWELNKSKKHVFELLTRPTGIIDPEVIIKPSKNEIMDLIEEIEKTITQSFKVLVSALTKRIAEDLTKYLSEKNIKTKYLHSDIKTLERTKILISLRRGEFDVLVGINLLREGLDLPEIGLVAILDAENEGFLRSKTALIQTMGRASRNINGRVIIYADTMTKSINQAIDEINRRRKYQIEYNKRHNITPVSISKLIKDDIVENYPQTQEGLFIIPQFISDLDKIKIDSMTPHDIKKIRHQLTREMKKQAKDLHFEMAIAIRDKIEELNHYE